MKFNKAEKSWILYDWANSSYATIMMAALFPIYFVGIADGSGAGGDMWWGIATSLATATIAILAPLLGAIGNYKGMKKKMLTVFLILGLISTASCAIFDSWIPLMIGYIFSFIGFSGSCLLYDSLLTDVTEPERMDKLSSWGYGMGYIGGSTIPFLLCIAVVMFGEGFGIDATEAVKISVLICVLWWSLFSIPLLRNCKQRYGSDLPETGFASHTFSQMFGTIREMLSNKGMRYFVLAYFFYIDGVNTVITMATAYGTAIGLDDVGMILALLVTQVVAFPCAILFGRLASRYGSLRMLLIAIGVYFVICVLGFYMGFGMEEGFLTAIEAGYIFWGLSVLLGSVQGGIQALSRSYFGKLVPPERSGSYFGVFDIFGKFSAVLGPALYSAVRAITGRSSFSILAIILLFLLGFITLSVGKKHIEKA